MMHIVSKRWYVTLATFLFELRILARYEMRRCCEGGEEKHSCDATTGYAKSPNTQQ
jgi:hypothetical protein